MSFTIDKQTLDELNLLGKFRQGSIYGLFCQVKTRGAEQLLDHMFRHPLDNAVAINERSSIFRFFQEAKFSFPFDVQQIGMMRDYLDSSAGNSAWLVLVNTLVRKGLAVLMRDERYRKTVQGLQAVIITLNRCNAFLETAAAYEGPYAGRIAAVKEILSDGRLQRLANIDIYQDLPVRILAFYDYLLKNKLHEQMESLLSFIYEVDVNVAVSDVARSRGFTYAIALPEERNVLSAADLRHPSIQDAVGNNLQLYKDSNVLFLTGANMAGKSTLMKSIGIGLYLAHMGFPVAADSMEFSIRQGLYTSINVADNINLGYSHFYAEVVRVKQAAEAVSSGRRMLLMFDELFKGTNVKDAFDGTLAVTEAFAVYRECLFIISTHIIEVGEMLRQYENIRFAYMPTIMNGVHPQYTYRLREGITEDRQGMMIIRNEGILELIEDTPV
ncbi:MAG: DNA mismatch repair protein [Chitinophaga sp.]|uniref:MutS-related protein n=1 Tax=Chitinophaga sp. TaxID=1869181 RepID=UPI001B2AEEBE|nr:DNA mismatch repair protein [Chitinophaga sp.]MBO9728524.1 DNA mismatch repair protein [Chitinophaga sp.]